MLVVLFCHCEGRIALKQSQPVLSYQFSVLSNNTKASGSKPGAFLFPLNSSRPNSLASHLEPFSFECDWRHIFRLFVVWAGSHLRYRLYLCYFICSAQKSRFLGRFWAFWSDFLAGCFLKRECILFINIISAPILFLNVYFLQ